MQTDPIEDEMFNTRTDGMTETVPAFDQEAYDNHVYGSDTPEQTTDEKLDELLTILRPLAPVIAALPELMEKVDPLLEGLRTSPVLKMMGVKF